MCQPMVTSTCMAAGYLLVYSAMECERLSKDGCSGPDKLTAVVHRADRPPGCFHEGPRLYLNTLFNSTVRCTNQYECYCCDPSQNTQKDKCETLAPSASPTLAPSLPPTHSPTAPTTSPSGSPSPLPSSSPSPSPTQTPSSDPTAAPSQAPTAAPTFPPLPPTVPPSMNPTVSPTPQPTRHPRHPTDQPTANPSASPTTAPTQAPVDPTAPPSMNPTTVPTASPTRHPVHPTAPPSPSPSWSPTPQPTASPVHPTEQPTFSPTTQPTTSPTLPPVPPTAPPSPFPSASPTTEPSASPVHPTDQPSASPTASPTPQPTSSPVPPTSPPTRSPTFPPSPNPTDSPVPPTSAPSWGPTMSPSPGPTRSPEHPTSHPSGAPSLPPTKNPSTPPTSSPTQAPTWSPTVRPTGRPSLPPTAGPTRSPVPLPTSVPTRSPTLLPSTSPSSTPSGVPTPPPSPGPSASSPSPHPTGKPSSGPTGRPSTAPSPAPSARPSAAPSAAPSLTAPSEHPSVPPSPAPSAAPSAAPLPAPSRAPQSSPPTVSPSRQPTRTATETPTAMPTRAPVTAVPTGAPVTSPPTAGPTSPPLTGEPTAQPTAAPVAIPGAKASQATAGVVEGAAALGMSGSGAGQASRGAAMLLGCDHRGRGEEHIRSQGELSWTMSPTGLKIGASVFPDHAGCVVGNIIVLCVLMLLMVTAAKAAEKVMKRDRWGAEALLRFPSVPLVVGFILSQGACIAGARLLRHAGGAVDVLLGLLGVGGALALPLFALRGGRLSQPRADRVEPPAKRSGWLLLWLGPGEWVSLAEEVVQRWGSAFKEAMPEKHWVIALDMALATLAGLNAGVGGGSCGSCGLMRAVDFAIGIVFCGLVVTRKPYVRPLRTYMTAAAQLFFAAAAAVHVVTYLTLPDCEDQSEPLPGQAVATGLTLGGLLLSLLALAVSASATAYVVLQRLLGRGAQSPLTPTAAAGSQCMVMIDHVESDEDEAPPGSDPRQDTVGTVLDLSISTPGLSHMESKGDIAPAGRSARAHRRQRSSRVPPDASAGPVRQQSTSFAATWIIAREATEEGLGAHTGSFASVRSPRGGGTGSRRRRHVPTSTADLESLAGSLTDGITVAVAAPDSPRSVGQRSHRLRSPRQHGSGTPQGEDTRGERTTFQAVDSAGASPPQPLPLLAHAPSSADIPSVDGRFPRPRRRLRRTAEPPASESGDPLAASLRAGPLRKGASFDWATMSPEPSQA
eukprot:TRINITY_DN32830_c0_g1_i1.p1 TRINITY_DN32830_c0_g1~~TRINITY_DN32830_c0_g1_i1.p1  ORF type:complete len:1230 (+),score=172.91 TRINITY_DN32830_c0_g1_i1:77-3766(+)